MAIRTLVCILAETRAHELTWTNFRTNVLEQLNADLAVCIGVNSQYDPSNPYFHNAKYRWTIPEFDDYGAAFDFAARHYPGTGDWRILLDIRDQWLGGIKAPNAHPGSGGILIFFRWWLLKNIIESRVNERYDLFIVTRSDHFYTAPHPPADLLCDGNVWMPDGEDYGGITDRHMVLPQTDVQNCLSLMDDMLSAPDSLLTEMKYCKAWNLERYILSHFIKKKMLTRLRRFPRVMFTVRGHSDGSRWSMGSFNKEANMIVKYPSEYEAAVRNKDCCNGNDAWSQLFATGKIVSYCEPFSATELINATWRFSLNKERVVAEELRLMPDYTVAGFSHPDVTFWGYFRGSLCFENPQRRATTMFLKYFSREGAKCVSGPSLQSGTEHVLTSVNTINRPHIIHSAAAEN